MDADQPPSPAPSLYPRPPSSSSLLRDVSNFKTPKRPQQTTNYHSPCPEKFFTASKLTPKLMYSHSLNRRGPPSALSKSKTKTAAARRLKLLELEQSQSAYKSHLRKEQSFKTLSKSLTVWLNFLLQNPKSCGCCRTDFDNRSVPSFVIGKGKREGGEVVTWRSPKRQRDMWWRGSENETVENEVGFLDSKYLKLNNSLKNVCSFYDLKQRMRVYLSLTCCKEICDVMTQVTKNIDEGRLRMKSHCPIVTDVGMKEKAIRVLMCYNPTWLRIGLYVIFGGDSLLSNEDINSDQEMSFLKTMIEKQFFTHARLAKTYAYNKNVEGLYKPGYYEILGNIILKRFLLLVLVLDRAKSKSSLPLKYGIDGVDGGSPLLFLLQSSIKTSSQVILDFLSSDVMHGEGNIISHLVIVGYKVSYKQKMVVPSDTRKKNLTNCGIALQYLRQAGLKLYDQDGTEIIEDDVANGDKELVLSLLWNMFVHLQLPLLINKSIFEEEICKISETRELEQLNSVDSTSLDLLLNWIQVICKKYDFGIDNFSSLVDGKAIWCLLDFYFRKELCCSCFSKDDTRGEESIMSATDYHDAFHNFILSQKLTKLLGNFPEVLQMSDILEHNGACSDQSVVILLVFLASQLMVKKNMDQLNFHKLLGCNCKSSERRPSNINRCLVNSGALPVQEEKDHSTEDAARKFKALQAWWREMADNKYNGVSKPPIATLQSLSTSKGSINIETAVAYDDWLPCFVLVFASCLVIRKNYIIFFFFFFFGFVVLMLPENASKVIQSHFRSLIARRNFLKMRNAVLLLQIVSRAWLAVKQNSALNNSETSRENQKQSEKFGSYVKLFAERHSFVKLKQSVLLIQQATRLWITRIHQVGSNTIHGASSPDILNGTTDGEKFDHGITEFEKAPLLCQKKVETDLETEAAVSIQFAWLNFKSRKSLREKCFAATKIQSHFRGWLLRRRFLDQRRAAIQIQNDFRCLRCWREFQQYKTATKSAIVIQSYMRGWIARRRARRLKYLVVVIQSHVQGWTARQKIARKKHCVVLIQSYWKGHLARKESSQQLLDMHLRVQKSATNVVKLQRWWRHVLLLNLRTKSAIIIQSHVRGWTARQKVARKKHCIVLIQSYWKGHLAQKESSQQLLDMRLRVQKSATNVVKLQRWWRHVLLLKLRTRSAIIIQSHVRGWTARQKVARKKHCIVLIQCYWKGHLAQKKSSQQLLDMCLRLQRWWRHVLLLKLRTRSAIIIQSHVRGWIARQKVYMEKHCIVLIQSYWKGYLARKESNQQLLDLRFRVQKSATNVDDSRRIINRLLFALSELLSMKSVTGILHTCATLDMATEHSQKCCEKLVAAGAIGTLLKLIHSVSRSIPDQEVLKHALSTLRNLARYPHLIEVLIDCHGSVETIFLEMLRNKDDGYFIASQILKKICSNQKGLEAICKLRPHLKRLKNLVEELTRKASLEKRNTRSLAVRENIERRLGEATELVKLITHG
ncbi:hypothetical protein EZV62_026349 [Acer yangbiense]|uniref:Calponin-homology (CH) domain-containing protein n=1 Tax=Acer yangbiense TaxID=1000413 RepID=A0A5C7GR81_9ROSI|nr:hypothetical protein EZV62_026349 [Acer yangbiense]